MIKVRKKFLRVQQYLFAPHQNIQSYLSKEKNGEKNQNYLDCFETH